MGELARVPQHPEGWTISTKPDPQGSSPACILTRPYTSAACPAGVVTVTAGRERIARAVITAGTEG